MLKNLSKILDPDQEADDFQNLISSLMNTDTYVVKFSWRSVQYSFYVVIVCFSFRKSAYFKANFWNSARFSFDNNETSAFRNFIGKTRTWTVSHSINCHAENDNSSVRKLLTIDTKTSEIFTQLLPLIVNSYVLFQETDVFIQKVLLELLVLN